MSDTAGQRSKETSPALDDLRALVEQQEETIVRLRAQLEAATSGA